MEAYTNNDVWRALERARFIMANGRRVGSRYCLPSGEAILPPPSGLSQHYDDLILWNLFEQITRKDSWNDHQKYFRAGVGLVRHIEYLPPLDFPDGRLTEGLIYSYFSWFALVWPRAKRNNFTENIRAEFEAILRLGEFCRISSFRLTRLGKTLALFPAESMGSMPRPGDEAFRHHAMAATFRIRIPGMAWNPFGQ
ncbi:UNVERIFIED_ORG: hypothetical protein GGD60_005160 [Rhizobium esperanzae]